MGERFKIELAGYVIEINSLHPYIRRMCGDYISDKKPDFCVFTQPEDIARERALVESSGELPYDRSDGYLETLAVERKLAYALLDRDVLLFHASALALDGDGYLFTAPSGTGKSTHARLWRERFGQRVVMVNDDKPLLRLTGSEVYICGTPWNGKHHLSRNTQAPLKGLCLLERDTVNHIERITPHEALPAVIQQSYRPEDRAALIKALGLADRLTQIVPIYKLGCNMDVQAAKVSCTGMRGQLNET